MMDVQKWVNKIQPSDDIYHYEDEDFDPYDESAVSNIKKNGKGTIEYNGGVSLIGIWENGKLLKGKLVDLYIDETYVGSFKNNLKDGFGKEKGIGDNHTYLYIGDFKDNYRQGLGKIKYPDSGIYCIGNFYEGQIDGFVYAEFDKPKSNTIFIGYFKKHKKNGFGFRLHRKSRQEYKEYGYWKDDKIIKRVEEEYYLINYEKKFQKQLDYIKSTLSEKESKYDSSDIESELELELELKLKLKF